MTRRLAAAWLMLMCLAAPLGAQDVGEPVLWSTGHSSARFAADPASKGLLWSAEGLPVPLPWDTVLFQGVSPEESVRFEFSRRDAAGTWGEWAEAEVKRFPEGRFWGRARLGPAAPGALRLRAVAAEAAHPRQVNLVVFDPKTGRPLQALSLAC